MSDLTRDEVGRACEVLPGWECHENPNADPETELAFWVTVGRRQDPGYQELFQTFAGEEVHGDYDDAMRVLEATGEGYRIDRFTAGEHEGYWVSLWRCPDEDPITLDPVGADDPATAAIRAVNVLAALARAAGRQEVRP